MSEQAKHTPGPWAVDGETWIFSRDTQEKVAEVNFLRQPGPPHRPNWGRIFADAAIIAAAPELLDALRDADAILAQTLRSDSPTLVVVRKAIAKAEGR